MTPSEEQLIQHRIHELQLEHHDLNYVIELLTTLPLVDELVLRRLKKRKLAVKDHYEKLADQLIPDYLA